MPEPYRRHDLLDVEPGAWAAALARRPDLADLPHVAGWTEAGRPVVLRRSAPGEAPDHVPVGLPLPPRDGKRRLALLLPPEALRLRRPVTLPEARRAGPASWAATLAAALALGERRGGPPRPFGSLLWQDLTGLPYLSASSDLDLLWPVAGAVPRGLLDDIAAIDAGAPMRLDGEILLPDGGGVNWRELHGCAPGGAVLVKHRGGLALRDAASLLEGPAA